MYHDEHTPSTPAQLARARELVNLHGWNATAYQILNPGIDRWFSHRCDAVVGFVEAYDYRMVAGAPVCAEERLAEVVEEFEQDTRVQGRSACYFAADERLAELLRRRGPLDRVLLGAQPVWDPATWPDILGRKASLRAQLHRALNKGVRTVRWTPQQASGHPELTRCLREWLGTRGLPPLHFLVEPETLGRLHDREIFVAQQSAHGASRAVGFLIASPIPQRRGWLIEQTIRGSGAPNGTSELLLSTAMETLAAEGAEYVTLGLSPLSRRAETSAHRHVWWLRLLLGWTRAHGRRFYNFEGLDAYKAKFLPERWEPIWAITGERRITPGTLWAIAAAFGKMSPILLVGRALLRAAGQEARWLRDFWLRDVMASEK